MPDFYVPISTGSIDNLNDTIAKGPNLDFINNIANSYFQGKDQAYTQANRDVFKQGLPKDANGNIDWNQVSEQLAKVGGAGQTQNLIGLQNVGIARQAVNQLGNSDVFSPIGSPAPNRGPPSSATAVPNRPVQVASAGQPNVASDVPSGTPAPPGQNITQPNETGYNVSYGPPQTGPLPAVGQPPTQVAQAQPAQPSQPGMDEATARMYDKRAADAARAATALAAVNPAQSQALRALSDQWAKQSQIIRGSLAKNAETTPEQKNLASGAAQQTANIGTAAEGQKKLLTTDVDTFQKENTGIQSAAQNSYNGIQKAQLAKSLTMSPTFYSGPLNESVQAFNQFKSIFGSNPSSALPQEAFNKAVNDMLQEQVKSMGQSGVGRVLQSEVNIMRQSIASLGITPQSNRALLEIVSRVYKQSQDLGKLANGLPKQPGQMTQGLNTAVQSYLKSHPLFTQQELQDPSIIGAPDAPPQSAQWNMQQKRQWAQSVGLKPGDIIRFNGQPGRVP